MAKIIPAKLAEVTQKKNINMATIQEVTGVPAKDIYNDSITPEELSKISKFLGVNCNFLIRPEITYKDMQDLKAPLDWSLTIPEGAKLKKDGTIDKRSLRSTSTRKGTHKNGYVPNKLVKDMIYMIYKDKGYVIQSLNACTGFHIDVMVGKRFKSYINPDCVINLCYYLDCDPSDIYDGPIDIDHISRKIFPKDKFSINKQYKGTDANTLKAIANIAYIPDKFMREFFDGALISKKLMQRIYNAFTIVRKSKGKPEVSPKDFCNCPDITMSINALPKENDNVGKLNNAVVKKSDEEEKQIEIEDQKKKSFVNEKSYASIKKSFIDIISYLSYEELDAYKELLESEKLKRDANNKINKYL
jgi:hypothetical protein